MSKTPFNPDNGHQNRNGSQQVFDFMSAPDRILGEGEVGNAPVLFLCVLASGSSGNVAALWTEDEGILIDCGRSRKYVEETLRAVGADITRFKGILVTHGHGDHVGSSMCSIARRHRVPIHIHAETFRAISGRSDCRTITALEPGLVRHHTHRSFRVGSFEIRAFPSSHDGGTAGKPHGFAVTWQGGEKARTIGYLTDTGKTDEGMIEALSGSDVLVLEANHDPELVRTSSRHWANKRWILGESGHLSNQDSARTIAEIIRRGNGSLRHVFLAHISEQHNTPETALAQVKQVLDGEGLSARLHPTFHRRRSVVLRFP